MSNQLSNATNYNIDDLIFSDPVVQSIPDSDPKIEFKRINISTKYEDGNVGDLIFETERLYSFGVSENKSPETQKVNSWSIPLCMWNRDGPSDSQKAFTDLFDQISEKCKDHVIDTKEELELFDLEKSDLRKISSCMYWKTERVKDEKTKKMVSRRTGGPTLYAKLIYSRKNERFVTNMYDPTGESIEPRSLIKKHCYARAAVKIESIFIGRVVCLQVKVIEAEVEERQMGNSRMLSLSNPPSESKRLLDLRALMEPIPTAGTLGRVEENTSDNEDAGSIKGSDSEEEEEVKPKPKKKKKTVKRLVRNKRG